MGRQGAIDAFQTNSELAHGRFIALGALSGRSITKWSRTSIIFPTFSCHAAAQKIRLITPPEFEGMTNEGA